MQVVSRPASERFHSEHGWLDSRHTFSFAEHDHPAWRGFSDLRVVNEDRVAPGRGFGTHPHRDMEILSYVVSGALTHRDTLGTGSVIRPGEIQLMSAGRGIAHSESNGSRTEPVHFLQIWILPRTRGTAPGYQQRAIPDQDGLVSLASPDGRDGALTLGQDAELWRLRLPAGGTASLPSPRPRVWVQVVRGTVTVDGRALGAGDGLGLAPVAPVSFVSGDGVEALVFSLR